MLQSLISHVSSLCNTPALTPSLKDPGVNFLTNPVSASCSLAVSIHRGLSLSQSAALRIYRTLEERASRGKRERMSALLHYGGQV